MTDRRAERSLMAGRPSGAILLHYIPSAAWGDSIMTQGLSVYWSPHDSCCKSAAKETGSGTWLLGNTEPGTQKAIATSWERRDAAKVHVQFKDVCYWDKAACLGQAASSFLAERKRWFSGRHDVTVLLYSSHHSCFPLQLAPLTLWFAQNTLSHWSKSQLWLIILTYFHN